MIEDPKPVPFDIERTDEWKAVSNGRVRMAVLDPDGEVMRRRAIKGLAMKPPAEMLIPMLNEFAGNLLAHPDTPPIEAQAKLFSMAQMINTKPPTQVEWGVVKLGDVYVYTDGFNILVTRKNLQP